MKKLLGVLSFILVLATLGQAQRPLGTWVSFPAYDDRVIQVCQSADRIYFASYHAVYYMEKSDGSISTLSKSNGLSDAGVLHIAYHAAKKTLVITYDNSNIDLLVNGTDIYNIPDIKNTILNGSKNINDISIIDQYAYLSTDLGISVLDLDKKEIKENYNIGSSGGSVKVNSTTSDGTIIYAATDEGLKSAPLSSSNLQDYHNWRIYGTADSLPPGPVNMVGQNGGRLYVPIADSLYVSSGGTFSKVRFDAGYQYKGFSFTGGSLYALLWADYTNKILKIQSDGSMVDVSYLSSPKPHQITIDGTTTWVADDWYDLVKYDNSSQGNKVVINASPTANLFRLAVANDNTLYYCAGGIDENYLQANYDYSGPIIYSPHDGWRQYKTINYSILDQCRALADVALDNDRSKAYFASLRGGLIEMDMATDSMNVYNENNSPLQRRVGDLASLQVPAVCVDPSSGNVWMVNTSTPNFLCVKTPDGHWGSFALPTSGLTSIRQMLIDDYGQIWMGGYGNYLIVYNPGTDVLSSSDDQVLTLTTASGYGAIPSANLFSIVKDRNGDIWFGTDAGIGTFYCAGSVFASGGAVGCDATRIKVNVGGFIGYLFGTESVKAMAIDGANRKWVGTTNGVWLISEDGTTQLLHFTADNSPLPSNQIVSISVAPYTGEVYIGTSKGLVSYQGDAILGNSTKGNALVYPNPVKHNYDGLIAIKGLVENAYVKITDAAGILVYQGKANGGQMIWNGKGYNGNRVATGIYLVYAAADDGSEHNVGKIIFIN